MLNNIVNSWYFIYIVIVLALLLPRIPFIGKFFNVLQTAIHELGHAITTVLLGGSVKKIELFQDSSGTAYTQNKSKFTSALTAFMGYPFAAIISYLAFFLLNRHYENGIIFGLMIILLFMLILWIRNIYGFIWTLLFLALNSYIIYLNNSTLLCATATIYVVFITIESIYSSFIILCLSFKNPAKAGDAKLLHQFTGIHAAFWGFIFFAISGGIGFLILRDFLF